MFPLALIFSGGFYRWENTHAWYFCIFGPGLGGIPALACVHWTYRTACTAVALCSVLAVACPLQATMMPISDSV